MKTAARWLVLALLLAGCAAGTAQQAPGRAFTGEVWAWDKELNTVTMRQGTQFFRVQVTPDQLIGLEPQRVATVRGELAPPPETPVTVVPGPPMVAVPSGPVDEAEVMGTVSGLDPDGRIAVDTPRGRVGAWVAPGAAERFPPGSQARVRMAVQRLALVAASAPAPGAASPGSEPAAMTGEPGDYATVTGRVLRVDASGLLTVETPRGPIVVLVPDTARYAVGESVRVRTSVHAAQ
jgi:hypothetical protein